MRNIRNSICKKALGPFGLCLIALVLAGWQQAQTSQFDREIDTTSGPVGYLLGQLLAKQIDRCWKPPAKVRNRTKPYRITLKLRFSSNGTLSSTPVALSTHSGRLVKQTTQSAVEAVERCAPYDLPGGARFPSNVILVLNAGGPGPLVAAPRKRTKDRKPDLLEQISRCWNPPTTGAGFKDAKVRVKVLIKPDGMLQSKPVILNKGDDTYFPIMAASVQRALLRCAPYELPADFPGELILTFDPGEFYG